MMIQFAIHLKANQTIQKIKVRKIKHLRNKIKVQFQKAIVNKI